MVDAPRRSGRWRRCSRGAPRDARPVRKNIGIGSIQVCHSEWTEDKTLEHRLLNNSACHLLIGAYRLKPCLFDSGREGFFISGIKIYHYSCSIGLFAERHKNKAKWIIHYSPPCQPSLFYFCYTFVKKIPRIELYKKSN
jgi:hypothetical protein